MKESRPSGALPCQLSLTGAAYAERNGCKGLGWNNGRQLKELDVRISKTIVSVLQQPQTNLNLWLAGPIDSASALVPAQRWTIFKLFMNSMRLRFLTISLLSIPICVPSSTATPPTLTVVRRSMTFRACGRVHISSLRSEVNIETILHVYRMSSLLPPCT